MTTATLTLTEKTVASLIEHRDAIRADLAKMGANKIGTPWHTDRVNDLQLTIKRLDLIEQMAR